MNIFKLLSKIYLLSWIKSLLVSAVVGSLIAIFFGFFADNWFVTPAFLGFWLPMALFASLRCLRDRKLIQPFDDVLSVFDKNATHRQYGRCGFAVSLYRLRNSRCQQRCLATKTMTMK
ncbi:MAG: hypothetical protein ACI8WB_002918 [Phenylobacterium sp.]|jgi:hypothetical protein